MSEEGRDELIDDRDWPELTEWPELMPTEVSPDFVELTCRRVFRDQRRIADEAERVDEIQLPADLLAHYSPPETSRDFSDRVLAMMAREPALPWSTYATPEPSEDFVERTLAALRVPVHRSSGRQPRRLTPARLVALAAALILALVLWQRTETSTVAITAAEATAVTYSPAPWATAMATHIREREPGAPELRAADPLLLLAMGALTERPDE